MVAFRTLFTASATLLAASLSVAADTSIISVVEDALNFNGLKPRQAGIDTSGIPDACKGSCSRVLDIANCSLSDIKCFCSNDVSSAIQSCYSCALTTTTAKSQSEYQSVADKYVAACKSAGSSVNSITVSKDNAGKGNGAFSVAPSLGLLGLGAAAIAFA